MTIRPVSQGLRGRFLRWTVILTFSICVAAAALYYLSLHRVLNEIGSNFATQYTLREKGRILAPLEREVALCETLAKMPVLVEWTQHEDTPALKATALGELEAFRKEFRDQNCFFAIRDSGHYYFRDEATGAKGDFPAYTLSSDNAKDAWFYSTLKAVDRFHLNIDRSVVRGQTMVFINTVVYDGDKRVAVAGTALKLDSFIERLVNSQNKAVTPILVDPSGAIQAHSNSGLIDQNTLSKKPEDRSTIFKLMSNDRDREDLRRAFVSLKASHDSVATFSFMIENQHRLVSVAYLPEIDWYLVSLIDLSKTIRTTDFAPLALVGLLAVGVLAVAIGLLINRTILTPLGRLTTSARAIAAGNYSARATALHEDELGELTRTFNSMLDTIESNTRELERHGEELEQRVRDRTIELETQVAERKKAETAAQLANQAKSEFLANMSHEIRTPMNAILGFSEILANKIQDPRHREYIQAVHSSGKSLLGLINDVLDLSKVEAGKMRLEFAPLDPRSVLRDIETIFSRKVEEKGLIYTTDIAEGFPTAVLLDEARLRQVLLNLAGNAIKFTEHGFVRMVARTGTEPGQEGLRLIFEVHDSGVGIPAGELDTIFGAFEQRLGQSHAKYGGTGLGLAISKRLVELMGGTLSVESAEGKGSTFRVTLQNVEESAIAEMHCRESAGSLPSVTFEPATILVAEDITLNRELIKGFLEGFDLKIVEAMNGREAVDLALTVKPSLILMDIKMPVLDGVQASRILKDNPVTQPIPIVAVTASTMKTEEEQIGSICEGFLRKPITQMDLLNVLMRFLKHTKQTVSGKANPAPEEPFFDSAPKNIHDPEGLRRRIETDLAPMWHKVKSSVIINEVLAFAERTIAIASTHRHAQLANWGDKLRNQAMLFDMPGMEQTLAQFPSFLDRPIADHI